MLPCPWVMLVSEQDTLPTLGTSDRSVRHAGRFTKHGRQAGWLGTRSSSEFGRPGRLSGASVHSPSEGHCLCGRENATDGWAARNHQQTSSCTRNEHRVHVSFPDWRTIPEGLGRKDGRDWCVRWAVNVVLQAASWPPSMIGSQAGEAGFSPRHCPVRGAGEFSEERSARLACCERLYI